MRAMTVVAMLALGAMAAGAASNIDPAHPYAYGANIGWINARGDGANGGVVGQYYCSGFVWSANCGWIGLGNRPANGWQYTNGSATDWGVNHDGQGRLSGYAYGANIGWINFEQTYGQPRIDLRTGNLSGYVWGANVGWISLSNAQAYVRTTSLDAGPDSDADHLPDAYEYQNTNTLAALSGLGGADFDGDGATDAGDYGADTDPLDPGDSLRIVALEVAGGSNTVAWTCRPTRLYWLETTNTLMGAGAGWADAGPGLLGPPALSPMEATVTGVTLPIRFYRVRTSVPLSE